jgi:GH15 family glucan-1,4-alpha-glucosidase
VACLLDLRPRTEDVHLFCSHAPSGVRGPFEFELAPGEEAWAVLSYGDQRPWTPDRAREAMDDTVARWRRWTGRLRFEGRRRERVLQSLLVIRLLGFAPTGSLVAAPTTSLPERIGGDWNADYRLAWVRDGSLSLQALARHGDAAAAQRYFDWLIGLRAPKDGPLQVLYGVDGAPEHRTQDRRDFEGYRHSAPVRFGNHAYRQKQLGMFGFLADCASSYREHGGTWRDEYFDLIARAADHCAAHWSEADNGIWELAERRHRVSSRVGSWVALDRAAKLAEATGCGGRAAPWHEAMRAIRDEVLGRGYSERLGAFREDLEGQSLDAANLLVPILRFLPGDDPRVVSTVDAIARDLTIDGWVHRFVPREAGAGTTLALGDFEGSFVLCTCWLASAYALGGRLDEAETVLDRVDEAAGPLGLLPEGIDARTGEFLGNYPLLFSHAEYVRAAVEIEHARARARG